MEERKLGLLGVTSLTMVALIGTGLYFGPALSAKYVGSAAIIMWILLAIMTIYIAFIFSELVALHPKAGGIYEFAKQAYGRFPSFLIGWVMWLVSTINTSVLIVGALLYAFDLPNLQLLIAGVFLLVILSLVAYRGLGACEIILDIFAGVVIVFATMTIIGGLFHFDLYNYSPFFTSHVGIPTAFSENFAGIFNSPFILFFVALFFIIETYFGWEAACFLSEETKNPRKTIPKALIYSSLAATVLGTLLVGVIFGVIPATGLASSTTPLIDVFKLLFGDIGVVMLKTGVFLSLIGGAAGNVIAGPRLLLAMARDKLFIEQFSQVSSLTGTPAKAILFQGIVSGIVLVVALGEYQLLLSIMVPLALFMYIATMISLPVLRIKQPGPRAYKCPFPFVGPFVVSLVYLSALFGWLLIEPSSLGILKFILSLVLFGGPIYLLLNIYYNPSAQLWFSNLLAYPALALENFIMPPSIRMKMLTLFASFEGKTILELGSGVGSLTMHLADAVTPEGRVYAIEAGKSNINLLLKRLERNEHKHVVPIHDEHHTTRLHPEIKRVDAVFSTGMLGYFQDKQKILKEIANAMPEHGQICFMEWVDYFGFLPNPAWLNDKKALVKEFRDAGFSVRVEKVKGLMWNYLLVYGVKSNKPVPYV